MSDNNVTIDCVVLLCCRSNPCGGVPHIANATRTCVFVKNCSSSTIRPLSVFEFTGPRLEEGAQGACCVALVGVVCVAWSRACAYDLSLLFRFCHETHSSSSSLYRYCSRTCTLCWVGDCWEEKRHNTPPLKCSVFSFRVRL